MSEEIKESVPTDHFSKVITAPDGNLIKIGHSESEGSDFTNGVISIVKPGGEVIARSNYNDGEFSTALTSGVVTESGEIICTGYSIRPDVGSVGFVMKTNLDLSEITSNTCLNDIPRFDTITLDHDNNLILSTQLSDDKNNSGALVVRADSSDLIPKIHRIFGGNGINIILNYFVELPDGRIVTVGLHNVQGEKATSALVCLLNKDLELINSKNVENQDGKTSAFTACKFEDDHITCLGLMRDLETEEMMNIVSNFDTDLNIIETADDDQKEEAVQE